MTHPTPTLPINVQHSNPYTGLDRGLFTLRAGEQYLVARVHAARWSTVGSGAAVGYLEFQLMAYATEPVSAADYAAGALLTAPDGSTWFDCQTRGLVVKPIMVEYWASTIYYEHYLKDGAQKLTAEEINNAKDQATVFTRTQGRPFNIQDIDYVCTYNAIDGQVLTRTARSLTATYGPNGEDAVSVTEFPAGDFDPVVLAMNAIRQLSRG